VVEGSIFETICFGHGYRKDKYIKVKDCLVRSVWLDLKERIEGYLESISIMDLLDSDINQVKNKLK
jgi:DNA-binding IscR family transcriptional regulator